MNYLELCQRVVRYGAVSGAGSGQPLTVVGQTGRLALIVDWVAEACAEIESEWTDYSFRSDEIDVEVPAKAETLDIRAVHGDVERVNERAVYARTGRERRRIEHVAWRHFRDYRSTTILSDAATLPAEFSSDPSGRLHFAPVATIPWTLRAEVVLAPTTLSANDSEPRIPEPYHMAIVYRALMSVYAYDESPQYGEAEEQRRRWMAKLDAACLPMRDGDRTAASEVPMVVVPQ